MAFVVPYTRRLPSVIGSNSSNNSRGFSFNSGADYANNLSRFIKPGITFNTQLNLNMNSSSGAGSKSDKKPADPKPPNNNGGDKDNNKVGSRRPNKKYSSNKEQGYFAPSDSKTALLSFSSNIKSGTLVNPFQVSDSKESCSLYTLGGSFFPVTDTSFYNLIIGDIYHRYITKLQSEINYKIDSVITPKGFYGYFVCIVDALQLYYSVDSILAYTSVPTNSNNGMMHLRRSLSAEVLSKQEELKRLLLNVAIPPNLLVFINYMYQNFRFEDLKDSAIFRLEFRSIFHSTSNYKLSPDYYDVIIDEVRNRHTITSVLLKGFPSYRVSELIASSSEPILDPNFKTFWYNSNSTYINKDSEIVYNRIIETSDQSFYYGSLCNDDVDGIFYACSSPFNRKTGACEPGIWSPFKDPKSLTSCSRPEQKSSLLCYDSKLDLMIAPCSQRTACQSGLFHSHYYIIESNTRFVSSLNVNPASQKVQVHNVDNIAAAVSESVLFLFKETN